MPENEAASVPAVVAAAMRLADTVRNARREAEQARRTPAWLAEEIGKAGLYQLYLPRALGGPETPSLVGFESMQNRGG